VCRFGLFALSCSVVQSKIREIGIRKVLGATPRDIVNLLTVTFLKRIALALAISAPAGYYLMHEWLKNFAYKITMDLWILLSAACIVTLIGMATLTLQTIRAALLNPVDELKIQ
jgi:putative ABC transport system permease protein